jgi:hypothetical protein
VGSGASSPYAGSYHARPRSSRERCQVCSTGPAVVGSGATSLAKPLSYKSTTWGRRRKRSAFRAGKGPGPPEHPSSSTTSRGKSGENPRRATNFSCAGTDTNSTCLQFGSPGTARRPARSANPSASHVRGALRPRMSRRSAISRLPTFSRTPVPSANRGADATPRPLTKPLLPRYCSVNASRQSTWAAQTRRAGGGAM